MNKPPFDRPPSRWQDQPEELWRLLQLTCDNQAQPEEIARLEAILQSDPRAQELYLAYLEIHASLQWRYREDAQNKSSASPLGRELGAERQASAAISPVPLPPTRPFALPPKSPVLGFLAPITRRVPGGEATVGGLVVLVLIAAFWSLSQAIMHPNLGDRDLAEDSSPLPTVPPSHRPNTVATITDTADVEWSRDTSSPLSPGGRGAGGEGDAVRAGQPLSITAGLVELQLKQGVTLLIEGPAEWTIDGNNNATLKRGKLVAKVPQQAIGFTLDTPTAKIVDLGTEFGAQVNSDGSSTVTVLKGKVETRSMASNGKAVRISAGQSVRLVKSSRSPEAIPYDPTSFAALNDRPRTISEPSKPVLLFGDNFNVLGPSDDINPGLNDQPGRQSGSFAPLKYVERQGKASESTRLGSRQARNGLLLTSDAQVRTSVSPAADFLRDEPGPHRYAIEFLVNPGRLVERPQEITNEWAGVLFGVSEQVATMPDATGGVGFLIRGNGGYALFDGTGGKSKTIREGSLRELLTGGDLSGWYKLRVTYEVPAFDGKSRCQISIAVNERPLLSYQTEAGFTHNFVILDGNSYANVYHAFDDLRITHETIVRSVEASP